MRNQLPRRPRLPAPGRRGDRPARGGAGGLGGRRPVHHRPRRCRAPARRTAAVTEGERLRPRVRHRHRARLLLTFGSLSDRFGRKGMLLAGLTVVGAASLAGGFTTTSAQLIAARALMGLGAAMTFPATLSLISNVFTERRERARAIGLWGAVGARRSRWARSWGAGCWSITPGRRSSSPWCRSPPWPRYSWRPPCPPPRTRPRPRGACRAWCFSRQPWRCWCSPLSRRPPTGGGPAPAR